MPHTRLRHATSQLFQRLKFSRVVSIQGARQVGKSFLARELIQSALPKSKYITLDKLMEREFAQSNPDTFLESHEGWPLIIDEAQKSPPLFDAIKWRVDENPKPGQFLLLGSTEFSKELQIRESLTGRLSRVRLYSMNLAETESKKIEKKSFSLLSDKPWATRKLLLRHLEKGGFPGVFSIHDNKLFHEALTDWIRLTLERDILQFPKIKVDVDLATKIFSKLATIEEPSASHIAKSVRCDTKTCQKILNLLQVLFAVHKMNPHPLGTGKPLYFYCDVSLASYFGASFSRKLWTWMVQEQLSQRSYIGDRDTEMTYYRNSKGSLIHLVLENKQKICPLKLIDTEKWDNRDYEILKSFQKKAGTNKKIYLTALASSRIQLKKLKIEVFPFESLA